MTPGRLNLQIISIFLLVMILATGVCWKIYKTTLEIDTSFSTFTGNDLPAANHLLRLRTYFKEYERLLYEYYATVDRTRIHSRLAVIDHEIISSLEYLQGEFPEQQGHRILQGIYNNVREQKKQLDEILSAQRIDWDASRETLRLLSEQRKRAEPVLNELFEQINIRTSQNQEKVERQLTNMTRLVLVFVFITLVSIGVLAYSTRMTLLADAERRRLALFPERSPTALYELSEQGEVLYANPASHRLAERISEALSSVLPKNIDRYIKTLHNKGELATTFEYEVLDHVLVARLLCLPDLGRYHLYISDITERRRAENELEYTAYHDVITGLPNRSRFTNDCKKLIEQHEHEFCLFMIGFYRFEPVYRELGLNRVDNLLGLIADRLIELIDKLEEKPGVYRLSGASFAVLTSAPAHLEFKEYCNQIASEIIMTLSHPFTIQRRQLYLRPCIGASVCPSDADNIDDLLSSASIALSEVMSRNEATWQFSNRASIKSEVRWRELESLLRRSLNTGEFNLAYQPKIDANNGNITGLEALLRWSPAEYGPVSPEEFVPIAEDSGLIIPIGKWINETACRQYSDWYFTRDFTGTLSINLSKLQFQESRFVDDLLQIIGKNKLTSSSVEIEITESLLMEDLDSNIQNMKRLCEAGVSIALDDFGKGYSSLAYLQQFPISRVKIDKIFVSNLELNKRNRSMVQAIIQLAHSLGIQVTAEGIEKEEQADILTELGCDELQGYYYYKPLHPDEIGNILNKQTGTRAGL